MMPSKLMPVSESSRQRVEVLSFAFALTVVATHCSWSADSALLCRWIVPTIVSLCRTGIFFFFLCSGYFLARHFDEDGWWGREVRKRIFSLGVPFVVWTLAVVGVTFIETGAVLGPGAFGINLFRQPALAPLWYVRCLMLFILSSPVWKPALERGGVFFLVGAYVVSLGFAGLARLCGWSESEGIGCCLIYGYSIEGLFFFLAGMYLQRHGAPEMSRRQSAILLLIGLMLLAAKLIFLRWHGLELINLNLLMAPPLLAGLWGVLKAKSLPGWLAGCAFSIYLMHGVVLISLRSAGGTYHACNPWLELSLGIVIPIAFSCLVHRYVRRASLFLFGGR